MSDPWWWLGATLLMVLWLFIAVAVGTGLRALSDRAWAAGRRWWRWFRTRSVKPTDGQKWRDGDGGYFDTRVLDWGVSVRYASVSFGVGWEEWPQWRRASRAYPEAPHGN